MPSPRNRLFAHIVVCLACVIVFAGRAAAGQHGFVYALQQINGGTNMIHGYRFDSTTGTLTPLPGFPVGSGGTGTDAASSEQIAYRNGRLYVVNDGSNTLTAFSVNRVTGALTAMPFSPVALGTGLWGCVDVPPGGSPVVVGNANGGISSFVVTGSTATPAAGNPFSTGTAQPYSCRFSQSGLSVYTGGNNLIGTAIAGFNVTAGTGLLSPVPGSPLDSGSAFPSGYATDFSGRLFMAGGSSQLRVYEIQPSGRIVAVAGNPFASGLTNGIQGVVHPAGFYLVADRGGNRVGSYRIDGSGAATTLTAVSGSPFNSGGFAPTALAVTADGAHVLAANSNSRNLAVFEVNQSTGTLASTLIQPVNALGGTGILTGLAYAGSENGFVYTLLNVDGGPNQIYGFSILNTGALVPLSGFPIDSGGIGTSATYSENVAYNNGRLYMLNAGSKTLTAFKVNRKTGALTPLAFSPVALGAGNPLCVAVHPSGSPLVVGSGPLASYVVGAAAITAAAGSPFATGTGTMSCRFSHTGDYVYAGSDFENHIAGFAVNAVTGELSAVPGSPFDSGGQLATAFATDSTGRLFVAASSSVPGSGDDVRVFTSSSGVLGSATGNPFDSPLVDGAHGAIHPAGYYMVADSGAHGVVVHQISGSGAATTVTAVSGSPFTSNFTSPSSLSLSGDGRLLVAANSIFRNLTVFRINTVSGALTPASIQPPDALSTQGRLSGVTFVPLAASFTDETVTPASGVIKAIHFTELRTRIDAVRARYGMAPYAYTQPTLTVGATIIRAADVEELRAAIGEVYEALGSAPPSYTDASLMKGVVVVKAAHLTELRAAVTAIE